MGIAVSLATNISLTMLSLSQQCAAAGSEARKSSLLTAGQVILAANDPLAAYPGTGAYVGLLLIAVVGTLFSLILLAPYCGTAIVDMLASGFDLAYCLTFTLTPVLPVYLLLAVAGLLRMI